jgi:hypothetical protein
MHVFGPIAGLSLGAPAVFFGNLGGLDKILAGKRLALNLPFDKIFDPCQRDRQTLSHSLAGRSADDEQPLYPRHRARAA